MSHVWGINQFSVRWRFLPDIAPSLDIISFAVSLATRKKTSPHMLLTSIAPHWPQLNTRPPLLLTLHHPRLLHLLRPRARRKPLKPLADGCAPLPRCQPQLLLLLKLKLKLKPRHPQVLLRPRVPPATPSSQLGKETQTRGLFYLQGLHGPQQTPVEVPLKSTVQTAL